jgi:hypothetical protein
VATAAEDRLNIRRIPHIVCGNPGDGGRRSLEHLAAVTGHSSVQRPERNAFVSADIHFSPPLFRLGLQIISTNTSQQLSQAVAQ